MKVNYHYLYLEILGKKHPFCLYKLYPASPFEGFLASN